MYNRGCLSITHMFFYCSRRSKQRMNHHKIVIVFLLTVLPKVFCSCEEPYGNDRLEFNTEALNCPIWIWIKIIYHHLDDDYDKSYVGNEYCANSPNGMFFYWSSWRSGDI